MELSPDKGKAAPQLQEKFLDVIDLGLIPDRVLSIFRSMKGNQSSRDL